MFNSLTGTRALVVIWLAMIAAVGLSPAQTPASGPAALWSDPAKAIRLEVGRDIPLTIEERDLSATKIQILGAVMIIDLRCRLTLRNQSDQYLRGLTLSVVAQQVTPGGQATVALPGLNIEPDATVPVRVDLRLVRPFPPREKHAVSVEIDGVLFSDLTFSDLTFRGPDRFGSRRKLMFWDKEAERDRRHFKSLLAGGGKKRLEKGLRVSLERQRRRPRLAVRLEMDLANRLTRALGAPLRKQIRLALLQLEEAPLEMLSGTSLVRGSRAQSPEIIVRNASPKPVKYFELGWLVSDAKGTRYTAGSVPASPDGKRLAPGGKTAVHSRRAFAFRPRSAPAGGGFSISAMSGYVRQVEFEDGSLWIPSRASLEKSSLTAATPVSVEEQRLSALYRDQGLDALVSDLSKF